MPLLTTGAGSYQAAVATTTFDPAKKGTNISLSNGNLTVATLSGGAGLATVLSIAGHSSGKYYCEAHQDVNQIGAGIGNASVNLNTYLGIDLNGCAINSSGQVFINNSVVTTIQTCTQGDTVCMAVDFTNSKIWFRTNGGNWNNDVIGNQNPATNTGGVSLATLNAGPYFVGAVVNAGSDVGTDNFGATAYAQTAPSGFVNW